LFKIIRSVLFYVAVAVIVLVGVQVAGNWHEISDAIRQFRERKPAFSGSAFDGWQRSKQR